MMISSNVACCILCTFVVFLCSVFLVGAHDFD